MNYLPLFCTQNWAIVILKLPYNHSPWHKKLTLNKNYIVMKLLWKMGQPHIWYCPISMNAWTHMKGKQPTTNLFFLGGFSGELRSSEEEDEGWYSGEEGLSRLDLSLSWFSSSSALLVSSCCSSPISARLYIVPLEIRRGGVATWHPISRVCAETWVSERNMP